jgi:hypothetical protein
MHISTYNLALFFDEFSEVQMKVMLKVAFFALVFSLAGLASCDGLGGEVLIFRGASDASAAVAVGEDMFIVADDENNVLRIYKTSETGRSVFSYDMTKFLGIEREHPEADIEGATMIGRRIYWITSHGRNKDGKMRPNRYRFFATSVKVENDSVTISPIGKPSRNLVRKLVNTETMRSLGLDKATRFDEDLSKRQREKLAPKEKGLNIEALCASADGRTIYIGFRNPRPVGRGSRRAKAIVVPLHNPNEVVERAETPIFGEPILWDMKGLGIRSMEYSNFHKAYFVIAGSFDEGDEFALYSWSGKKEMAPVLVRQLSSDGSKFNPEALVPFENSGKLLLLSDDGSLRVKVAGPHECLDGEYRKDGTCQNKYLLDPNKKTFRGILLVP